MKKVRFRGQQVLHAAAGLRRGATPLSPTAKAAISGLAIQVLANILSHLLLPR